MTTLEILIAARAKIAKPENWCTGVSSMTADGKWCEPWESQASKWCAYGAIAAAGHRCGIDAVRAAAEEIQQAHGPWKCVVTWEELKTTTHADVMALFDRAIEISEAEAAK